MTRPLPFWLRPPALAGWRALLVLLLLAVCWLALTPRPPAAAQTGWDKADHLLAFITLALVASIAWVQAPWRAVRVALALLAFGAFIELAQLQVPGRSAEWSDLLADAAGIGLGLACAWALLRSKHG